MRLLLVVLVLMSAASGFAQSMPAATEISVRLFSTHTVREVEILSSGGATSRACVGCAASALPAVVRVKEDGGGLVVSAAGGASKPMREMWIEGDLRVRDDAGHTAAGAGRWRIAPGKDGLHVALALPSERYVMAVLSSEAPAGASDEALKALAVAARSFALTNGHRHGLEGVCDSTHCQAMRLVAVPARIEAAVRATEGETLWHDGVRVAGYFTQSCGGTTEDGAIAWGGAKKPWLVSHADPYCQRQPSQWHAAVPLVELQKALVAEGIRVMRMLRVVRVAQRDASGRVTGLKLDDSVEKPLAASTFRFAVNRSLGWNTLRSDWYDVRVEAGKAIFDGKGYGHGVGLCQFGAEEMARQGKSYREILGFYFPTTQVRISATDAGWKQRVANGWTLRSTADAPEVVAAGDAALLRARALLPGSAKGNVVVTIYPGTELFRQAAKEPGWMLAATRGESIALQPAAITTQHGGVGALLLHEFLHSLVEQRAAATTPLWLREGLVEVLAGERPAATSMTLAQISLVEEGLAKPKTQAESQRAHRAAAAMVSQMIAQHGMPVVLHWLESGVPGDVVRGSAVAGK